MQNWIVFQDGYEPVKAGHYASIFAISNGYFGTRGTDEESSDTGEPSTYIAGTFSEDFIGVDMLPNTPNWLFTEIEINGELFSIERGKIIKYRREYNLKDGILYRWMTVENSKGDVTEIVSERFASQQNRHLGVLKYKIRPLNYSGKVILRTGFNLEAKFRNISYVNILSKEGIDNGIHLSLETTESNIVIAESIKTAIYGADTSPCIVERDNRILIEYSFDVSQSGNYELIKFLSIYTSRDEGGDITKSAIISSECALRDGYETLKELHISCWRNIWKECDLRIYGDDFAQLAIRFCMFHLISASNPEDDMVNLGAKLLTGDGYRHHVFWDTDLFMMPFFTTCLPEYGRKMAVYRYNTLEGARRKAKEHGYKGAWYPWESSDTGYEVSPKKWIDDKGKEHPINCWLYEIHSVCDVAYAVWDYYITTGDRKFLYEKGFEILYETARFWLSRGEWDSEHRSMSIRHVTGPDENHDDVDNSAYINYLARWNIIKAVEVSRIIRYESPELFKKISSKINIKDDEIEEFNKAAKAIKIPFDPNRNIFIEFEGYEELKRENAFEAHKRLTGEGELRASQVVKQSDVIMLMYLFRNVFPQEVIKANWDYYVPRTEHNSSLSACTHSIIASMLGLKKEAYDYFITSAGADLKGIREDTEHGVHAAAMGGTWQTIVFGFAGLIFLEDKFIIKPALPDKWTRLTFPFKWRGASVRLDIRKNIFSLQNESPERNLIFDCEDTEYIIEPKGSCTVKYQSR